MLERGDKPENGEGLPIFLLLYSSVQLHLHFQIFGLYDLAMQGFHPCSHPSLVLKPSIIFTFLIHSGSLQNMLTVLFNLVRNTQKSIWTVFFEC